MREKNIDILKGIGIIAVVIGHITFFPQVLIAWVYSFHIPLFFFVSGYLFKFKNTEMSIKEVILSKIKRLIIPYAVISVILMLYNFIIIERSLDILLKRIVATIYSAKIFEKNYVGAIWFLTCLFSVEIIFFIVLKKFNKYKTQIILSIAVLGFIYPNITSIRLPFGLDIAFVGIMFYYLGFLFKENKSKLYKPKLYSLFLPINIIAMYINYLLLKDTKFNGRVDMLYMNYGNVILFIMAGISGILFLFFVSNYIKSKIIVFLGQNSLIIMGFHLTVMTYVIITVNIIVNKILGGVELGQAYNIVILFGTLIGNSLLILIYNKLKKKSISQ